MKPAVFPARPNREETESHWLSVSDLMAGLMIIFLLIGVSYMRLVVVERDKVVVERDRIKNVVVAWERTQDAIYRDLLDEFRFDLEKWRAEIDRESLAVRFKEPEVLFGQGRTEITDRFRAILDDFFPRYVQVLDSYSDCGPEADGAPRGCIEEIRIEGHTSSEWDIGTPATDAYFNNMWLSQERARSVLRYCYLLQEFSHKYPWLMQRIASVGFSSSRLIYDRYGFEDVERSRRVEFRVKTTIEKQLMRIIQE